MALRWDVGAELGLLQRFSGIAAAGVRRSPGPTGELQAHVALAPMIRVGAYAAQDISPVPAGRAQETTEAGLRIKITPPILSAPWHAWAFAGVGYARAYAPSYTTGDPPGRWVPGAGGGMLALPFGVGLGARLRAPLWIFAELTGRTGLAFTGTFYEEPQCLCSSNETGRDSFALALRVGVSLRE